MPVRFPLRRRATRVPCRSRLLAPFLLLAAACSSQNASAPFHANTDSYAARQCLARGFPFFRRIYPSDAICLRDREGPEVTDARAWLAAGDGER